MDDRVNGSMNRWMMNQCIAGNERMGERWMDV